MPASRVVLQGIKYVRSSTVPEPRYRVPITLSNDIRFLSTISLSRIWSLSYSI